MRRGTAAGVMLAALATFGATRDARAEDGWTLEPSGQWTQTSPSSSEPPLVPRAAEGATQPVWSAEAVETERRSGIAMAGAILMTVVGAPFATFGGLALFDAAATRGDASQYAASGAATVGGLAVIAGGVALIVWGGERVPTSTSAAVAVGPGGAEVRGSF